jgi:hypothetical protein
MVELMSYDSPQRSSEVNFLVNLGLVFQPGFDGRPDLIAVHFDERKDGAIGSVGPSGY